MYIHEVIIDGFKSYAQRTVVSGFDPQFNAITGLNGTGKSNILDSICFVLGISNLSQVRVGNLQELVYKQGQAGVTKASVTIVFNNSDPSTSPVGYESHKQITVTRQVVIGGKNKYLINGHTVQQSQIQNFFHSVQLNVNNPHFLIMQGRITKVLNMKPEETLSMIEEAAGTRMFETKKQAALKTIEKKQLKVEELTKCMDTEIIPTLSNLRNERQNYLTWQSNNTELERLERFCIASEFRSAEEKVKTSEGDKQKIIDELDGFIASEKQNKSEADECTKKIKEIEAQRESESEGPFQELKKAESELSKDLVKVNTLYVNQKETMSAEKENTVSLQRQLDAAAVSVKAKQVELDNCNVELTAKEAEAVDADRSATILRDKYQNACAGMADDTSAELLSLPEQVAMWEKKVRESLSQLQQGSLKGDHAKEALKDLRKSSKDQQASYNKVLKEADDLRRQIGSIEGRLSSASFSEADESSIRSRMSELKISTAAMKDKVDELTVAVQARLNFEFKDPEKGFDRSRVKGLVAKLVRVNDGRTSTALEIAAGAKLYQIIVDTDTTSKLLLQKGGFKSRVTFLPLNKINARCVDSAKMQHAKGIATSRGGTANLALELVGFDEDVRKAMEYVFGNTIICDKSDVAKEIAFDRNVRNKTVTLDGDSYDPAGTLSGGSKKSIGVLLCKIEELARIQETLDQQTEEYASLQRQIARMETEGAANKDLSTELELKRHALTMCEEKMADSSYAQINAQIESLEAQMKSIEKDASDLKAAHENAKEELKKLKNTETNVKKQREKAMKDMETQMRAAQKVSTSVKAELNQLRNRRDALVAEVAAVTKDLASLKEQVKASEVALGRLEEESNSLSDKLNAFKSRYEDAKEAVAAKQKELNNSSKEIKSLEIAKEKYLKAVQNDSLSARKLTHKLKEWEKDCKNASKAITTLLKEHPWIEKEKAFFGLEGSDYDFAAKDIEKSMARLKEIKGDQDRLAKKVNKKVMGMIEKAESEYEELARKKEVIMNDKAKIEAVIDELDEKKKQALQTTWVKVNRDFGSIFSTLLPGTHAKLEPPEGQGVADGLEVKVAFNGVWKDSLTELSGGQRSLLALSLILALLLFKPAPMYILDEVDAALDLSHTQNIGLMLRTHFSTSQFIVVSLKEGMFNNANVIFRTRFVDGVSAVTRTVVGKGRDIPLIEDDDETSAPQKKKGKASSSKSSGKGSKNVHSLENVENMIEA